MPLDCLIVGGGPAGLTAAIYLARFRLNIRVVDAGCSRAALIPLAHNHAGYPGGVSGKELLSLMREQAADFGAQLVDGRVEHLALNGDQFAASVAGKTLVSRCILLATGVVNNAPEMAPEVHHEALRRGLLRYCPICDGYEATDQRVAVIGTSARGFNEAIFLRMYSADITLVAPDGAHTLSEQERAELQEAGVKLRDGPCHPLRIEGAKMIVPLLGETLSFDTLYPALGSVIRSELAIGLGAEATQDGCLVVDSHQRTSVDRLYAAGDVATGLDQISHAMGEASVAATTIRNDLAVSRRLYR